MQIDNRKQHLSNNHDKYQSIIIWWNEVLSYFYPPPLLVPKNARKPFFVKEAERLLNNDNH